jgi:type I restriction enzyme S subunit
MRPSIDSRFLFSRLQEDRFVKAVLDRCTGTSYPAINASDLSGIEIMVPDDKAEQSKIGELFTDLDDLITIYQRMPRVYPWNRSGLAQPG